MFLATVKFIYSYEGAQVKSEISWIRDCYTSKIPAAGDLPAIRLTADVSYLESSFKFECKAMIATWKKEIRPQATSSQNLQTSKDIGILNARTMYLR